MSRFTSVTPNLVVSDIARSTAFYRDVLGFSIKQAVPAVAPFAFVWLERDDVPMIADRPFGGTAALFIIVTDVDGLHEVVAPHAPVVMALKTQFYGMREFAVTDPDGHIITFAERVSQ